MNILIATVEKEVYWANACSIVATTIHGELKVHPGHAPLLAILRPGIVRIDCLPGCSCPNVKRDAMVVLGGFMEIQPETVTILTDAIERSDQLDASQARLAVQHARVGFQNSAPEHADKALMALEVAIARLNIARKHW